jgi:hypothetical protein
MITIGTDCIGKFFLTAKTKYVIYLMTCLHNLFVYSFGNEYICNYMKES